MMKLTPLFLALFLAGQLTAQPAVDAALKAAVDKINASGASMLPVSSESALYRFTALNVAKTFNDSALGQLGAVAGKIESLDLARTQISDAGLKALSGMSALRELHLENTGISDAALDHVAGLKNLEYLNVYGTKVSDAGLLKLAGLSKLKSLYVWQSKVTDKGVTALRAKLPAARINNGWSAADDAKPVVAAAAPTAAKPAAAPAAAAPAAKVAWDPAAAAKAQIYRDIVAPILASKCVACHGEEKKKGKLQLHDFASILKGGSEGANTVIAKKSKESLMIVRAELPKDDDEHMPPADEPQLSAAELAILKWWIDAGAAEKDSVAAANPPASLQAELAALLSKKAAAPVAEVKPAKPKPAPLTDAEKKQIAEITAKLQAINATLMPLAQDTEQLRLGVVNAAAKFGDKELALLDPIAKHVLWVDVARSQVTDAAAATLGKMVNLERLHLENTKAGDGIAAVLGKLPNLEYVNFYGTALTDKGLSTLATAKALRRVFAWQSKVTRDAAKALMAKLPGAVVNVGMTEAEIAALSAPPPAPPAPPPAPKKDEKKAEPKKADANKTPAPAAKPVAKPAPAAAAAQAKAAPAVKPAVKKP